MRDETAAGGDRLRRRAVILRFASGARRLAGAPRWIDDNLNYSTLYFFPTYWAVNIGWHERPRRRIDSYAEPKGRWVSS